MAGIPLTAGFIAKFGVFSAAVEAGAWPLALLGVLASAVSVFFYVRIIVLMVLTPPADDASAAGSSSGSSSGGTAAPDDGLDGAGAEPSGVTATLTGTATRTVVVRTVVTVVGSRGPAAVAIALCAAGVLLLGVFPAAVLDLAAQAGQFRF